MKKVIDSLLTFTNLVHKHPSILIQRGSIKYKRLAEFQGRQIEIFMVDFDPKFFDSKGHIALNSISMQGS